MITLLFLLLALVLLFVDDRARRRVVASSAVTLRQSNEAIGALRAENAHLRSALRAARGWVTVSPAMEAHAERVALCLRAAAGSATFGNAPVVEARVAPFLSPDLAVVVASEANAADFAAGVAALLALDNDPSYQDHVRRAAAHADAFVDSARWNSGGGA